MYAGGERGSADSARDPRGFAVKFYTEEGNWDLVGNNTPIFFIRDTILVSYSVSCLCHKMLYLIGIIQTLSAVLAVAIVGTPCALDVCHCNWS